MPFVPDQQQPTATRSRFVPDSAPVEKRPHDPMNDPPLLPGEEGYVAPTNKKPSSFRGVRKYLGGLNDAARELNEAEPSGLLGIADTALSAVRSALALPIASAKGIITGEEPTNEDIAAIAGEPFTEAGRARMRALSALVAPLEDSGADVALLPLAGPASAVSRTPKGPAAIAAAPDVADPKVAARTAGYKLLPSEAGGDRVAQALESLGGPQLKRDFRRTNEQTTTKLAQEDIGAPAMNEKGFAKVREDGDAAYAAMSGIGKVQADDQVIAAVGALSPRTGMRSNPDIAALQANFEALLGQPWDAGAVVNEVRQLRKEANANSAPPAMGAKPDPKKQALAKAQIQVANALDDWLERNATTMGSPEIASQYREARKRLAKTASVERATSGGRTDVRNLERQDERGVPHSGRLKVAAQTGEYFPESTGPVSGPELSVTPDSLFGSVRNFAQNNLLRPIISRILQSDQYQNRLASLPEQPMDWSGQRPPISTGPEGPLAPYFDQPPPRPPYEPFAEAPAPGPVPRTPSESMRVANTLAGDLELAPEGPTPNLPPAPSRMTADVPPPVRGDVPFTASQPLAAENLAADLGFAPEVVSEGLPFRPTNLVDSPLSFVEDAPVRAPVPARAQGLANDLGLAPEGLSLDTVSPEGPFAFARGEPFAADPRMAMPPRTATIREPGAPGFEVERIVDLASDLGLMPELELAPDNLTRVVPDTRRVTTQFGPTERPGFTVAQGTERQVQNIPNRGLADELIEGTDMAPEMDMGTLMAELEQLALRQRPSAATRARTQNNASGESSASVEAINRVQAEKAAGQQRYLIDRDGTVTPLVGVDAVDAVARPGQVIVQKGVGAERFTILDRGGLNATTARGRVNAALSSLEGG